MVIGIQTKSPTEFYIYTQMYVVLIKIERKHDMIYIYIFHLCINEILHVCQYI